MKIAHQTVARSTVSELDMSTIRRRVAQIKRRWTPEEAQARAAEGLRRRRELDALVGQLLGEFGADKLLTDHEDCDDAHGLTLVG